MTLQEALKYSTDNRTHSDFVDAALAEPTSEVHPLVYADWLQEQGQEGLAEHIRNCMAERAKVQEANVGRTLKRTHTSEGSRYFPDPVEVDAYPDEGTKRVIVSTLHQSSNPKKHAQFSRSYSRKEVAELLAKMEGVDGVESSIKGLGWRLLPPDVED